VTLFVSTAYLDEAERCNRLALLHEGRLLGLGTPDEVKAQLQAYLDIGATHFMFWFADAPKTDGMQLFMEQVAPAFKPSAT
jgi:ABC-type multidrug transport system ATPase subunit